MRARLLLLVGLVAATCCGPAHRRPSPAATEVVWLHAETLDAARRSRALAAWEFYRADWERYHGRPAPAVQRLELWNLAQLPPEAGAGAGKEGWADWSTGTVKLCTSGLQEIPWAWHELCHLEFHDPDHADPRWAEWDRERARAVAEWLAR